MLVGFAEELVAASVLVGLIDVVAPVELVDAALELVDGAADEVEATDAAELDESEAPPRPETLVVRSPLSM